MEIIKNLIMKKYFLGLVAILLAIGFSAFTKPAKFVNYNYKFVGPSEPTLAQLQTRAIGM